MGRPKQIYFDDENMERLEKEENMSQLINKLLKDYYDEQEGVGLTKKQIEIKIKLLDLDLEYTKKRKEIENGNKN